MKLVRGATKGKLSTTLPRKAGSARRAHEQPRKTKPIYPIAVSQDAALVSVLTQSVSDNMSYSSLTGKEWHQIKAMLKLHDSDSMSVYLHLWHHPACGASPRAYSSRREVYCDGCNYRIVAHGGDEPLGRTLSRSEFEPRTGETFFG